MRILKMKAFAKIKTVVGVFNGTLTGIAAGIAIAGTGVGVPVAVLYVATAVVNGALVGYGALSAVDDYTDNVISEGLNKGQTKLTRLVS